MTSRLEWEPAIYEHKAALIGASPADISSSADLLSAALVEESRRYGADYLTVGVDVYNLEAEACGAEVTSAGPKACPDIRSPVFSLEELPRELALPEVPGTGRFGVMLEAGRRTVESVAPQVCVRVAASGPVTIATKLAGTDDFLVGLALTDESAMRLLDYTTRVAVRWLQAITASGMGAIVFDSAAGPPLIGPDLYKSVVLPSHRRLMTVLSEAGQESRPLVIGGDTTSIVEHLVASGATTVICDYPAKAEDFAVPLAASDEIVVRRNADPSLFLDSARIDARVVADYLDDLARFDRVIAGTGVLPFEAVPAAFIGFRRMVEAELAKG